MNENPLLRIAFLWMIPSFARTGGQFHEINGSTSNQTKIQMKTLSLGTHISRSLLRCGFFILSIALCCFALSPPLQAVNPPPDGGYGNQNTAEGTDALFSLTSGVWNVAAPKT